MAKHVPIGAEIERENSLPYEGLWRSHISRRPAASNPRSGRDVDAEHGSGAAGLEDAELGCVNPIDKGEGVLGADALARPQSDGYGARPA